MEIAPTSTPEVAAKSSLGYCMTRNQQSGWLRGGEPGYSTFLSQLGDERALTAPKLADIMQTTVLQKKKVDDGVAFVSGKSPVLWVSILLLFLLIRCVVG